MLKFDLRISLLSLFTCLTFLITGCISSWKKLEICDPGLNIAIPAIDEFGSDFVTLSGNNFRLDLKNSYIFSEGDIEIHLRDINNENVTFEYKEEIHTLGEADSMPPTIFTRHCAITIAKNDKYFQTRSVNDFLQPLDFTEEWRLRNYIHAVPLKTYSDGHFPLPKDWFFTYLDAEHKRENNPLEIPYYIYTETQIYESKESATKAFEKGKRFFRDLEPNDIIQSSFVDYFESCQFRGEYSCTYIGQSDTYIVNLYMSIPQEKMGRTPVPLEDWQYIINLVEGKILQQ